MHSARVTMLLVVFFCAPAIPANAEPGTYDRPLGFSYGTPKATLVEGRGARLVGTGPDGSEQWATPFEGVTTSWKDRVRGRDVWCFRDGRLVAVEHIVETRKGGPEDRWFYWRAYASFRAELLTALGKSATAEEPGSEPTLEPYALDFHRIPMPVVRGEAEWAATWVTPDGNHVRLSARSPVAAGGSGVEVGLRYSMGEPTPPN